LKNIEIIGLGALNIDHLYRVERILEDGEAVVKEASLFPGGSAANTIYGLAKLGIRAGFAGAIGDDAEGKILLRDFEKVGVDNSQIRLKRGERTGSVVCLSDSLGRRSLYVLPGANSLLNADDLDMSYINQAGFLHLSSFADDTQFRISLDLIHRLDSSTRLSFSPGALYAVKGFKALAPVLKRTHVLFTNHDEIQQLTGMDVIAGTDTCLKQGCRIIVVTLGRGAKLKLNKEKAGSAVCYIRDAKNEYLIEPPTPRRMSETDATGAGDAFAAGFLYGLLDGKTLEECGRLGDIVARFSITRAGARPGLPTLKQLSRRYQELYHQEL